MIRTFVALPLPEEVRDRLGAVAQMLPLPRRVPEVNLHLTLAFLGELPEPEVEAAHEELSGVRSPAFDLALRGIGIFGGGKPRSVHATCVPEPALDRLHGRVVAALRRAGTPGEARKFVPHVTLARLKPGEADVMRLEHALLDVAGFAAGPWRADRFVLFRSHLGRHGAAYEELASYDLG